MKFSIKYLVVTIIFVLSFSTITSFPASANLVKNDQDIAAYKVIQDAYNVDETEAIKMYEEAQKAQQFYKFDSSGSLYFDEEGALSKGVDESIVEEITGAMAFLENEVGEVKSLSASCKGAQYFSSSRAYFDSCGTDDLIIALAGIVAILAIAGIVTALLGAVAIAAAYEIAAVLVTFGVAVVSVRNKGCGIQVTWLSPSISSQTCK